jgi:ABC-type glutathione transport system ATPase component
MTDQPTPGGTLLEVRELRVSFGPVQALDGVSLDVKKGPFGIALVGESGSGKTTAGRAVLRLVPAAGGTVRFDGQDVLALRGRRPATRTSCPGASGSGSRSPARSRSHPACSSWTSRPARST